MTSLRECFMCGQDVLARSDGMAGWHGVPWRVGGCGGSLMPVVDGLCDQRCGRLWPGCGHTLTKETAS